MVMPTKLLTGRVVKVLANTPAVLGGETVDDQLHYVPGVARKPSAFRNGAPFKYQFL